MAEDKKIIGFKRFSDIKGSPKIEEAELNARPETDSDRPMLPNTPQDSKKIEKPASRKNLQPKEQDINLPTGENEFDSEEESNEKVTTYGRIARFPKNVMASKAYNFLENVKISKKSIWYLMVEKQENNELQLVKYNVKEGVDLNKFVTDLKGYYINKYSKDAKVCNLIESIQVDGNDKYSMVKNIPLITVDGRKMISIITEDLIKLLSK